MWSGVVISGVIGCHVVWYGVAWKTYKVYSMLGTTETKPHNFSTRLPVTYLNFLTTWLH